MLDADYEHYDIEVELTLFTPEEGERQRGPFLCCTSFYTQQDSLIYGQR